jgi:hypothetical protein
MMKRHFLLFGILVFGCLLLIATSVYPGGSQQDAHSTGFDWRQNYISNLFSPLAMNGAVNSSRPWAITGWVLLCVTVAGFFEKDSFRGPGQDYPVWRHHRDVVWHTGGNTSSR